MAKPPPYPADDEALIEPGAMDWDGAPRALCSRCATTYRVEDGHACHAPPPPDVYDFWMRHSRWPEPDEA